MRTELELWSELGKKLTSTHSVPEAVQIYQQSLTQRMQMAAEDSQKFAADCQKLAQKVARTMSPWMERRKLISVQQNCRRLHFCKQSLDRSSRASEDANEGANRASHATTAAA